MTRAARPRIRLSDACYDLFVQAKRPVVTRYDILLTIAEIARAGRYDGRSVYALPGQPTDVHYQRVVRQLLDEFRLSRDPDFPSGVFTVNRLPDASAEEACCLADPYCYVSHLSAMQHYGLTDRIPDALAVTRPVESVWRTLADRTVAAQKDRLGPALAGFSAARPRRHEFPDVVRGRAVRAHATKSPGKSVRLRDGWARIARIEQTFVDMLVEPALCGGMRHVLEVWRDQVAPHLDRVVALIDATESGILKVRAGYIISEFLGIENPVVASWLRYAQRGGSRRLDPGREYRPQFSEAWMISLNVDLPGPP